MGETRDQRPVLLIAAVSSKYEDAFDWAAEAMSRCWGPLRFSGDLINFNQTSYYRKEMGDDLRKQLFAFETLIDPADIASIKLQSNELEDAFATTRRFEVARPINIDPGYITEAKLVLATTKDRDHRIYLRQGIFAEVTLYYLLKKGWQHSRWTYPDYQREDFKQFFTRCRDALRAEYRA